MGVGHLALEVDTVTDQQMLKEWRRLLAVLRAPGPLPTWARTDATVQALGRRKAIGHLRVLVADLQAELAVRAH